MINEYGKLLFTAFIAIIIGVALIQPLGDSVESVKVGSVTVLNETLSFTSVTTDIVNESLALINNSNNNLSGTLTFDDLTIITGIRNISAQSLLGACNITLSDASVICNHTGYPADIFVDYTYISTRTDTLANDEVISLDAVRNASAGSNDYVATCDIVLSSGFVNCSNPHDGTTGYADYKYIPDTYVHSASARTMLTLVMVFFALGVLSIGIWYVWKSFKEGKII